ncbi:MAG TPA: glycosyltransferase family 2 protein [Acidobacteriota bacterium]|jgi:glycosyltransferase involved in cell wall biosynthesis
MTQRPKIVVVMPAYNAERTLERTVHDLPEQVVDEIILSDDCSSDRTVELARQLGLTVVQHQRNQGYGANQKTGYRLALSKGADIVVMLHPDYQYDPRVIPAAVSFLAHDICDIIIGNRVRTRRETLSGGMPIYKYVSNRVLTILDNVVLGQNLGDFHSGFRVFKRTVLETLNYESNSDDFIFDIEMLAQAVHHGFKIGDVPIPTRYFAEASSINFRRSLRYGIENLRVLIQVLLHRSGLMRFKLFEPKAGPSEAKSSSQ